MDQAKKHTAVIDSPVEMWSKLSWNVDVFRDIQTSYPDEIQPLAYAAIDVCIAARSLQDWTKAFLKQRSRTAKEREVDNGFDQGIADTIPEQIACAAIANTSKHSRFGQGNWIHGEVRLVWEEGDEDIPSGYVLYHEISGSHSEGFAVSRFEGLCQNWWNYLSKQGLTDGHTNMPEWRTNKLNRIFGHFIQLA